MQFICSKPATRINILIEILCLATAKFNLSYQISLEPIGAGIDYNTCAVRYFSRVVREHTTTKSAAVE